MNPQGAFAVGAVTAVACYCSVALLKHELSYDDSLYAFGIHGFGGITGTLIADIFFDNTMFNGRSTVAHQLFEQAKDVVITAAYSGIVSIGLLRAIGKICSGLRVERDVEREGLDLNTHGKRVEIPL